MSLTRPRYQLWQIMTAIAVFAGLFAAFGVIGTIAILIVISVLTVPVILAGRGAGFVPRPGSHRFIQCCYYHLYTRPGLRHGPSSATGRG